MSAGTGTERVAVIGAGTMGSMLALVFASGGHPVVLTDVDGEAMSAALTRACGNAASWLDESEVASMRIEAETELARAVAAADIVVEAVTEDLATKQSLFVELDRLARPSAILCSNTSALPIAQVTAKVRRHERVVGTHWFNPPHLVPAIEVIRGPGTSDETIKHVFELLTRLGKVPVEVKDTPGFLANRLQMALAKEAMLCVADGVASAEDIDRLFTHSIGFRLAVAGPLAVADFAGLDVYQSVFETLGSELAPRFAPPDVLTALVGEGHLGAKTGAGFLDHHDGQTSRVEARDRRLLVLSRLLTSPEWAANGGPP